MMAACATRLNTSRIIEALGRQPRRQVKEKQKLLNKAFAPKKK